MCEVDHIAAGEPRRERGDEAVVLIHGLWMRGFVLLWLAARLRRRGFRVHVFSYPTMAVGLGANVRRLVRFLETLSASRLHLVGHSLGGLLILALLRRAPDPRIHRAVLLGTPVRDCHCARRLAAWPLAWRLLGRSLPEWSGDWLEARPLDAEIGIVAGTSAIGLGRLIPGLPRPNDGVVAVAETRLAQARDSITLPLNHSAMLASAGCADQIAAFLRTGHFYRR